MNLFLITTWSFLLFAIVWICLKLLKFRLSPAIAAVAALYYAFVFLFLGAQDQWSVWPFLYCSICIIFIINGGKQVAYQTQTAVFDNITGEPIPGAVLHSGRPHWVDPILETATVSVNGEPNVSAELQEIEGEIEKTPWIQTKTRGIQAMVLEITYMLHLHGDVSRLFQIEGGAETVRRRIERFINQFLKGWINNIEAEDLDRDKANNIIRLANDLRTAVNRFCSDPINNYPYEMLSQPTIGDTDLDPEFYKALAKKAIAKLTQEALDVDANALIERIKKIGNELLNTTSYSDADRLQAAQITLGIVRKDIQFKKFGVDADTATLLKAIAALLKSK